MPHVVIKNIDTNLMDWQEQDYRVFAEDLAQFIAERFDTHPRFISVDYQKVPTNEWVETVFDVEIRPNMNKLIRKPGYGL